ncbi:MAG TPA: AmmeMemoRadiSam system protein B [Candidatus Nanoarchaeia archaeon]|nr:AmmeMemoRadiSam system protein B [Candidatus Nanoarchaeia archaeon]
MVRKSVVAGQFYSADPDELSAQIRQSFLSPWGPGKLPSERLKKTFGIIAPHAGYMYSGPCAAWSYKEIGESVIPDVYILLGLSHNGYGSGISVQDWQTPLGIVKTDTQLASEIVSRGIIESEDSQLYEHSIEVQLPFLQFVNKGMKFKMVAVTASPDMSYNDIARALIDSVNALARKVVFIASSDFTHFGMNYGYFPFRKKVKENMYALDKGAIEPILSLQASQFLGYTEKTGATICGRHPIACLLESARLVGKKKARLLKYYASGDVIGDYSSAVGYASIVL